MPFPQPSAFIISKNSLSRQHPTYELSFLVPLLVVNTQLPPLQPMIQLCQLSLILKLVIQIFLFVQLR